MTNKILKVSGRITRNGLDIIVDNKSYPIVYPPAIWQKTPTLAKRVLLDNLAFAETHFLPLILKKTGVEYATSYPLFEALFYKNQLLDMLICEKTDKVKTFSYLRQFYNLTFAFVSLTSCWLKPKTGRTFSVDPKTA